MSNSWKNIINKAKDTTSKAFGKGRDLIEINQYNNEIKQYHREIGKLVYDHFKNGDDHISFKEERLSALVKDIEYCHRKIKELSAE